MHALLLAGAIAAAVALMIAMASMLQTIDGAHSLTTGNLFGKAQLQIVHRRGPRLDDSFAEVVAAWPEVVRVGRKFNDTISLMRPARGEAPASRLTLQVSGVKPEDEAYIRPPRLEDGRMIAGRGEIVLDTAAAEKLDAQVGDELSVIRFGDPVMLKVVGIEQREKLEVLQRPRGVMELEQARELAGLEGVVSSFELVLREGADVAQVQAAHEGQLERGMMMQTTAAASVGATSSLEASRLLLKLMVALVMICASFIIGVSQTTALGQQTRQLAILRCIGGTRWQMAMTQLASSVMVTVGGTAAGVPLGLAVGYGMYRYYRKMLPAGFDAAWQMVLVALVAATAAGLVAGAWPAVLAWRSSPVRGLAARAAQPRTRGVVMCLVLGFALAAGPMLVLGMELDPQRMFWFYPLAGMPMVLTGYFLLSVPVAVTVGAVLAWPVGWLMRLPATLVRQAVVSSPYRSGLTAAALMVALALVVNIWSGGRSLLSGWFDQIKIPDAFIHRATPIPHDQLEALRASPVVTDMCSITAFPVPALSASLGVKHYSPGVTLFVSCEMESFFRMTDLKWVQGNAAAAAERIGQGQAVIVSEEYHVVHKLGVGDSLTLGTQLGPRTFEIAGVVKSPGLDMAVHFYGIGQAYSQASMGSVIGSREDAMQFWGVDAANLVLLSIDPEVSDGRAMWAVRQAAPGVAGGSSRRIREMVYEAADRLMGIGSGVAVLGLVIACLAAGNLMLAGLQTRALEFGVFRAIGSSRAMLTRLILAQTLLVAATACVLGVAMGVQATVIGQHIHRRLIGVVYDVIIPWDVVALGVGVITLAAVLATLPAIVWLRRTHVRELLGDE